MKQASWIFLTALSFLLAACGGSGSTNNPPPSSITLTVVDEQNQGYAAAYQVGNGAWTAFAPSSNHTYTFNLSGNTKYGVAVRCTTPLGIQVHILQSTNAEEGTPKVGCSQNTPSMVNYTLNVNVSGVPGIAAGDIVFVNTAFTETITNPSNPVAVNLNLPAGSQDLVVVVADSSPSFKVAKVIRNVNITNGGSSNVTLSSSDVQTPASVTYSIPSGFTPTSSMAMAFYLSADDKGTGLVGGTNSATSFSYRPVSGFASGDRYGVSAFVTNGSQILQRLKGSGGGNISLSLPNPWPAGALSVNAQAHPTVSGLNYSSPDLRSYAIYLAGGILNFYATLSKGWLGSSTAYTFPDLSAQLGYTPFSNGASVYANIFAILKQGQGQGITASTNEAIIQTYDSYTVGGAAINLP